MPIKNEADSCETVKGVDTKLSSIKKSQRASPESTCSEKQDTPSVEVCIPFSFLLKRTELTLKAESTDLSNKYISFSVDEYYV